PGETWIFVATGTSTAGQYHNTATGSATPPTGINPPVPPSDDSHYFGASPVEIGDLVWLDIDGDGVPEAGEPGIPGVTVLLYDGSGTLVGSAATGAFGGFLFTNLPPGDYTVTVDTTTLPEGLVPTYDPDGGLDSSFTGSVASGSSLHGEFGFIGSGVVGDTVWYDSDGDGTQGPSAVEPGIGGVDLTVLWAGFDGVLGTADDIDFGTQTTDLLGYYLFTGLPYGTYVVTIGGIPFPYSYFGPANIPLTLDALVAGAGLTADFPLVLAANPPEELPFTGFASGAALLLAALMLGLGSLLVGATRRREDESA
ncbi:MAG: MSCRAMM family adhesin SdrC, partial [Acidimicrobiia bacterium]|nr:MSCRAMM family adhesin SdrC [Acidimicrobiia bacterium]